VTGKDLSYSCAWQYVWDLEGHAHHRGSVSAASQAHAGQIDFENALQSKPCACVQVVLPAWCLRG